MASSPQAALDAFRSRRSRFIREASANCTAVGASGYSSSRRKKRSYASRGSLNHFRGACRPCMDFHQGRCDGGKTCNFCHEPHTAEDFVQQHKPSSEASAQSSRNWNESSSSTTWSGSSYFSSGNSYSSISPPQAPPRGDYGMAPPGFESGFQAEFYRDYFGYSPDVQFPQAASLDVHAAGDIEQEVRDGPQDKHAVSDGSQDSFQDFRMPPLSEGPSDSSSGSLPAEEAVASVLPKEHNPTSGEASAVGKGFNKMSL